MAFLAQKQGDVSSPEDGAISAFVGYFQKNLKNENV